MPNNLLDQLQHTEVPPAPVEVRREVHDRLNQWLLASQIAELVLYGFGHAVLQFGAAIFGLINFSLTGNYQLRHTTKPSEQEDENNDNDT